LENKPGTGEYYPQTSDLLVAFGVAVVLYIVRQFYEKLFVAPLGALCGLKYTEPRKAPQNELLEKEYKKKKNPNYNQIEIFAKKTELEVRHVERWYRLRRNQDRPSLLKRFTETGWRFTFYFGVFIYGITMLWDKPWLWESEQCWKDFPNHQLTSGLYWYYLVELGFYLSLMFSQFLDVKRKDFMEMFIHHIATVLLLSFSYIANFIRVGSLILLIHDCADFWVEGAKLAKYLQAHRLCDVLFAIFAIVWFVTRLVMYPLKILHITWIDAQVILGYWPVLVVFNAWLCLLLVLHVYWFSLIVKVAYSALTQKEEVDDVRSSTDEPVTDDESNSNHHVGNNVGNNVNNHVNNHLKAERPKTKTS